MTNILDDLKAQTKLDKSNLYGSVVELSLQCQDAFKEASKISVPKSYRNIQNVVTVGMGGSGLGARVINSVFGGEIKYPITQFQDYYLPSFADTNTLFICSSFSGETEEPVHMLKKAIAKKCKVMTISAGGTVHKLGLKHKLPAYLIDPVHNPSKQPRMAIGYSIIGQLVLASKAGLIDITLEDISKMAKIMEQVVETNKREVSLDKNPAKKLAEAFHTKQIVMVASQHLKGAFHVIKNQMNENAKQLSHRQDIPELNHHLLEGLRFPSTNKDDVVFWFANSNLYPKRIQQRMQITMDVVNRNKLNAFEFLSVSKSKLAQAFEVIQFGAFVNYYMTTLNNIDPSPIPWVDYLKTKLGQPLGDFK